MTEGKTFVLYDAASGVVPGESLMDFTDFPPGAAAPVYSDGVTVLDSTISGCLASRSHPSSPSWTGRQGSR
jgi:hypothetical protein